ncbi:alanine dehydrogenase [Geosporobacter ferrireducens]|uniref:alanine dehydrogenase n=1 Tax=Geosporobacter ferrireducens TaxID=1424294 RepID=A0A1D8GE57_9FIRM|nr:alanine dehydrogenase [Geosporobacter ferrireducens]AOT69196.1 hypothetical protein Gferi_06235 [Geosporobacter ferrireducens]MTI56875.1 alanine dehydrogenase [Geosporobacter ferrireducens]
MIIGIPKEIKPQEYRVASTPDCMKRLINQGHSVLVEKGAGIGAGFLDTDFIQAGAEIVDRNKLFEKSEMIYKVKEFFPEEFQYLREGLIIFTYIHSNAHREQTDAFLEKNVIGIAYEDIQDQNGEFPLLKPMSELAGKGGFIMACQYAQKSNHGSGLMLNRVHGVRTPHVTIIGAGTAGLGAAELAAAFQNQVSILEIDLNKLEQAKYKLPPNVELLCSNHNNLIACLKKTDVLMNCILWPKWRKDHLVSKDMLKMMKPGALIIDVSCDEAGAIETCRATSHDDPIYIEEGIVHYCVDNIPSTFARTATESLANATLPYALELANKGPKKALVENQALRKGLSFYFGNLTLEETGKKQNRSYITPEEALGMRA